MNCTPLQLSNVKHSSISARSATAGTKKNTIDPIHVTSHVYIGPCRPYIQ